MRFIDDCNVPILQQEEAESVTRKMDRSEPKNKRDHQAKTGTIPKRQDIK
jgi:hypothetical protein